MKIAFFGGTFDPVHLTHVAVAKMTLATGAADRLIFLPAPTPPHKAEGIVTAYVHRRAMLEIALRGERQMEISDYETQRSGWSYTIDTLKGLSRLYPGDQLFWLIGSDSLLSLHTWYHAKELVDSFRFLTYPRPGFEISESALAEHWNEAEIRLLMAGVLPEVPPQYGSSTDVREALSRDSAAELPGLLDPGVLAYIRANKLYIANQR